MATPVDNFPSGYIPKATTSHVETNRELAKVAKVLQEPPVFALALVQLHAAPDKPYDGMVVYADGTDWDPGSGEGFYGYYSSTWNKLG